MLESDYPEPDSAINTPDLTILDKPDADFQNADIKIPELESNTDHTEEAAKSDFNFNFHPVELTNMVDQSEFQPQEAKSTENPDQAIIQQSLLSICNYKAITQFQQQQQNSCQNSTIIDAAKEEESAFSFVVQPVASPDNADQAGFQNSIPELQSQFPPNQENNLLSGPITKTVADRNNSKEIRTSFNESSRPTFPASSSVVTFAMALEQVEFADPEPTKMRAPRPPLKPSHLNSNVVVLVGTDDASVLHRGGGYEDGAPADLILGNGAVDGASVKGEKMLVKPWVDEVASVTGTGEPRRGGGGFHRVSPIVANPPPLTAAVFPWDRNKGRMGDDGQWRRELEGSAGSSMQTANSGQRIDGSWKAVPIPPCKLATVGGGGWDAGAAAGAPPRQRNNNAFLFFHENEEEMRMPINELGFYCGTGQILVSEIQNQYVMDGIMTSSPILRISIFLVYFQISIIVLFCWLWTE